MKKGKIRWQFITLIILTLSIISGCNNSKNYSIENVKVKYVDFNVETIFSVSCDYFPTAFSNEECKYWQIAKKDTLYLLGGLVKQFSTVTPLNMNVRGIFEWKEKNNSYKYCFDSFGNFTDGNTFYQNKELFNFLEKC
jgi:hypothetical protein